MKSKFTFSGDTEYRLLAVGAYSFTAFSVAALIQILSSGTTEPSSYPYLAKIGFTVMPLLASGLALDFYCVGKPKMVWFASILCMVIGGLIGISMNSIGAVLGVYSPQVAEYLGYGIWGGVAVLIVVSIASWLIHRKKDDSVDSDKDS